MKINIFEGFKRLNQFVIFIIFVSGVFISFNQTSYINTVIHPDGGRDCISHYDDTKYLDYGHAYVTYCFDKDVPTDLQSSLVSYYHWTDFETSKVNKELRHEWYIIFFQGLGYTVLFAGLYILFCAIIKYIAYGFIKHE